MRALTYTGRRTVRGELLALRRNIKPRVIVSIMSAVTRPWVVLVIGNPAKGSQKAPANAVDGPDAMLRRALSLTALAKTCCVIAASFLQDWAPVCGAISTSNQYSLSAGESVLEGVTRCLVSIDTQDPNANVILIPHNHCAVEEASWLDSTKGALRLGSKNRNTVYLLHDNPDNDPRIAMKKPEVCSSSVMVGASTALLALCVGKRATTVVDLVADPPEDTRAPFTEAAPTASSPLNLVHIRLLEEYARLQRIDVWHRPSRQIDVHA